MHADVFKNLGLFIQKAEKLGKYQPGTAAGFRSAMDAFQAAWTSDEPETGDYLTAHAEEILTRQVETRALSANTFKTYLQRIRRVLSDWQRYGSNPKAMLEWSPKRIARRVSQGVGLGRDHGLRTLAWSLRPNLVIQIQLPVDFNARDFQRIQKLLELEIDLDHPIQPAPLRDDEERSN